MRIALATCSNLPDWETDDRPFHDCLAARGIRFDRPVWDDPDVAWHTYDACLIRTTWDYQERLDRFVTWAERVAAVTRLFNPLPILRWNTHKSYLRDLRDAGIPTVPTEWLERGSGADVAELIAQRGWSRAFLKPAVGATARETLRFDADAGGLKQAQAHVARLLPEEDLLLQPYLERVETEGEHSAIFIDGALTHVVQKIPVQGDYRVQDDFGAADRAATLTSEEDAMVRRAVAAAGEDLLYARVDFLRDAQGAPCVNELELVEPSLFFRHGAPAADRLAAALERRLAAGDGLSRRA